MGKPYWELEKPIEAVTTRNRVRWFAESGRLQVCQPDWTDAEGTVKQGKTVALNVRALAEAEPEEIQRAVAIFAEIAESLRTAALAMGGGGPQ